jgi:probable phosphoglycerate mutase
MTRFFLIRHATNPSVGKRLVGRSAGVHLNPEGQGQARALAERLATLPIAAVYASPLERARETAQPIADSHRLAVRVLEGLNECEFGSLTGMTFEELAALSAWKHWNDFRSSARVPGGELLVEVVARMVNSLETMRQEQPAGSVVAVSHGDPLRALLMHYLGMPLDLIHRIELEPASVSVLDLDAHGATIRCLNHLESLGAYA